jgi:hypothetical protein
MVFFVLNSKQNGYYMQVLEKEYSDQSVRLSENRLCALVA